MTEPVRLRVIPTLDKTAVALIGKQWRRRLTVSELPAFVDLYRKLRDREGGKYAQFYRQPTEALEAAAKALGIPTPDKRPKPTGTKNEHNQAFFSQKH